MPNPRFNNSELAAYGANCQRGMVGEGVAGKKKKEVLCVSLFFGRKAPAPKTHWTNIHKTLLIRFRTKISPKSGKLKKGQNRTKSWKTDLENISKIESCQS